MYYVYIYIYIYISLYIYIYIYIYMCVYIYIYIYTVNLRCHIREATRWTPFHAQAFFAGVGKGGAPMRALS